MFIFWIGASGSNSKRQAPLKKVTSKTKSFIKINWRKSFIDLHQNLYYIKFYANSTRRLRTMQRFVKINPRIFVKNVTRLMYTHMEKMLSKNLSCFEHVLIYFSHVIHLHIGIPTLYVRKSQTPALFFKREYIKNRR